MNNQNINNKFKNALFFTKHISSNENEKLYSVCYKEPCGYYIAVLEAINLICRDENVSSIIAKFNCKNMGCITHKFKALETNNTIKKQFNFVKKRITVALFLAIFLTASIVLFKLQTNILYVNNLQFANQDIILPRSNITKQISYILNKQNGIGYVILSGEAGIGKTTVARMFVRSVKSNFKWEIDAESEESLQSSFVDIANSLANTKELKEELAYIKSISNRDEMFGQIILFVLCKLKNTNNWTIIFDNVDGF